MSDLTVSHINREIRSAYLPRVVLQVFERVDGYQNISYVRLKQRIPLIAIFHAHIEYKRFFEGSLKTLWSDKCAVMWCRKSPT